MQRRSLVGQIVKETYQIDSLIGEGGPSVVYRGVDLLMQVPVAVKQLKTNHQGVLIDPTRFLREARTQARLIHQNIVGIRTVLQESGEYFIVMEYVEGQDLNSMIRSSKERPALPLVHVEEIFAQILAGLGYAHREGVIHRDIKPSNLLVRHDRLVKIADFGIAMPVSEERITKAGLVLGSPCYMSPEQITGSDPDHRSDIYSTAISLYETIAGFTPFDPPGVRQTAYELLQKHLNALPPSFADLGLPVPPAIEHTVMQGLAKDPAQRYPSCEAFLEAIQRAWAISGPSVGFEVAETHALPIISPAPNYGPPLASASNAGASGSGWAENPASSGRSMSTPGFESLDPVDRTILKRPTPLSSAPHRSPEPAGVSGRQPSPGSSGAAYPPRNSPPSMGAASWGPPPTPPPPHLSSPPPSTAAMPSGGAAAFQPADEPSNTDNLEGLSTDDPVEATLVSSYPPKNAAKTATMTPGLILMLLAGLLLGAGILVLLLQRSPPPPKKKVVLPPARSATIREDERSEEPEPPPLRIPMNFQDPTPPTPNQVSSPPLSSSERPSERPSLAASEPPPSLALDGGSPSSPSLPQALNALPRPLQGRLGAEEPSDDPKERPSVASQDPSYPAHTKGVRMVYIPEGGRGSSKVEGFWLDQYEVNVAQYSQCVSSKACKPAMGGLFRNVPVAAKTPLYYPIHSVTWEQADRYCQWAGKRLPTSREWERAARGDEPRRYPWGEETPDCSRAHFQECGPTLRPVGGERRSDGKSPFDVYDLAGSVWEWTSDCLEFVSERCTLRLLRGGSFRSLAKEISTSSSKKGSPTLNEPDIGVRCAWRPSR